jgi:hypothetical protein
MKTFLIQGQKLGSGTIIPAHDFGFTVIEAIKFEEWLQQQKVYDYDFLNCETLDMKLGNDCIPVGSVEFVLSFFKNSFEINNIIPVNIPKELDGFTNRKIERIKNISSLETDCPKFIKSMTGIKKYSSIINEYGLSKFPEDDYLVSEMIDIASEWRCFVYNGVLLDSKCYSFYKSPFIVPNINVINNIIKKYKNCPKAYTLDVCVGIDGKTSILEVHNFFSCGLYGFNDYSNYLKMLIDGIKWELNR